MSIETTIIKRFKTGELIEYPKGMVTKVELEALALTLSDGTSLLVTKNCCPSCQAIFDLVDHLEGGIKSALDDENASKFQPIASIVKEVVGGLGKSN